MSLMPRHAALLLWASLALAAACAPSAQGPTPGSSPAVSIVPPASTSPAPASTSPAPASTSPAPSSPDCEPTAQIGLLPSDRLVALKVSSTATQDLVSFVFEPSTPGPGGPPRGTLDRAQPPYSYAGSGQPIALLGERAVQVRFSGMTIASETGVAVYTGPPDVKPDYPSLREAIQYDASEGIIGWYIGYDGAGCVTLNRTGNGVTIRIAHPEAPTG